MRRVMVSWAIVAVIGMSGQICLAGPASWPVVGLNDLSDKEWSAAKSEGGKTFRVANAKNWVTIKLPAWWDISANANRPPTGSKFTFEIVYRDDAKTPIVLQSYSAAGDSWGHTELHRFGGTGDGQWKTAVIPSGWDLHYVRKGEKATELTLRADEDLPVESIRVREAKDEDLTRWEAETRAWVGQQQKAKRENAQPYLPAQKPELAGGEKRALVPYARGYLQVIFPNSAPQKGETSEPVRIRVSLEEYEPGSFAVYANGADLTNVTFDVSPLKGAGGELACSLEKRTAEYAVVSKFIRSHPTTPPRPVPTLFPERLWTMYPVNVARGSSHWFWIILKTDAGMSRPGKYSGTITVKSDQGESKMPLEVEVLDIRLPTMSEAGLTMGGCMNMMVPVHEMAELVKYNHNGSSVFYSGVAPKMTKRGDTFVMDLSEINDWMSAIRKNGTERIVWFLGGDPFKFPRSLHLERSLYSTVIGKEDQFIAEKMKINDQVLPAVKPLYTKWVKEIMTASKQNGWPEIILTPFDEPAKFAAKKPTAVTGPWIKPHFKDAVKTIHGAFPGARVYGSIHQAEPGLEFLRVVDVFCTNAILEDPDLGKKVLAQPDKEFWQYSAAAVDGLPDRGRFTYGWYYAAYRSTGSLSWAYNWYNHGIGKYDNSTENEQWGYGWTTPWSMVPAPYLQGVREAWDDRRYLAAWRDLAKKKNVDIAPELNRLFKKALDARGEGGMNTVSDFWEQAKHVGIMEELRGEVIEQIMKLSGK